VPQARRPRRHDHEARQGMGARRVPEEGEADAVPWSAVLERQRPQRAFWEAEYKRCNHTAPLVIPDSSCARSTRNRQHKPGRDRIIPISSERRIPEGHLHSRRRRVLPSDGTFSLPGAASPKSTSPKNRPAAFKGRAHRPHYGHRCGDRRVTKVKVKCMNQAGGL